MIKTLLFTLLVGGCIYFIWYVLSYELGLIDKEEASCFGVLLDGGYRLHQKYNGFSVLTIDIDSDCPPLIAIPVFSWEGEGDLYILPKARGITKVKYYFWKKDKNFILKKEIYEEIRATISLSKEVDEFLASHVEENRHGK